MTAQDRPSICPCSFCSRGLLRFVQCDTCDEVVAVCDSCELMWSDLAGVADDPNLSSESDYPACPHCGDSEADFRWLTWDDLKDSPLRDFTEGDSEQGS